MSSLKKKKQDILWNKKWRNLIQQKAIKEEMNKQLKASLEKQKQEEEEKECTFKPQTLWNQSFKKTISFVDEFFVKLKPYIEQQQAYLNQLKELEYDDQMFSQKIKEELRVMLSKAVDKEIMETIIEGYKGVRTRGINKVKREKLDILSKMIKLEREYNCFMARENVDKKDLEECGFDCDLAAKLRNDILKDSLCPNSLRDFAKIRQEINQVLEEELKLRESESATSGGDKYENRYDDKCDDICDDICDDKYDDKCDDKCDDTCDDKYDKNDKNDDKKDRYDETHYNTYDDNYLYEKNNQGYDINNINNYLYNDSHTYMTKENVIKQNQETSTYQHISKDPQINNIGEYLISNSNKGNGRLTETINNDSRKEKIIKENNNNNSSSNNNNNNKSNNKNNVEHDYIENKHYKKNSNMINIQNNYNNVKENKNISTTNNNIKYNKEENEKGEFTNLYNIVKKEFEISDNYNEEKSIQNNHNKNIYLNNNFMKILKNEEANKYISSLKKDVNSLNVIILNNNKQSNEKNRNLSSIQNGNINGNMENYVYEKKKNDNKKHIYNIINEKNNLNNSGNSEQKIIYTKNKNMIKNSKYDNVTERMIDKDGVVYMMYGNLKNDIPNNRINYSEVKLENKNTRYVDKNIYNVKNGDKFYDIYRRNHDNDSNNNNNNNNSSENEKKYHYNNKIYNISDDHVIYDNKQFYYTKDNLNYTNKKTPLINTQNSIVNVHNLGKDYNDNKKGYVNKPLLNKIFEKFSIH